MTHEVATGILNELAETAYVAQDALERGDVRESIRLVRKVVDLTYVALDGLGTLPDGAGTMGIENLAPALPVFKRALVAVTAGSCRLALAEVQGHR